MRKFSFVLVLIFALFVLVNTSSVFAGIENSVCNPTDRLPNNGCDANLTCIMDPAQNVPTIGTCRPSTNTIQIQKPRVGFATLGNAISNILFLAFAVAALVVLIMLIVGAFEWITSGGDKENVAKARNRIINALIGLAVLAVAFALANVFAQFTGLNLGNLTIPRPDPNAVGL